MSRLIAQIRLRKAKAMINQASGVLSVASMSVSCAPSRSSAPSGLT